MGSFPVDLILFLKRILRISYTAFRNVSHLKHGILLYLRKLKAGGKLSQSLIQ